MIIVSEGSSCLQEQPDTVATKVDAPDFSPWVILASTAWLFICGGQNPAAFSTTGIIWVTTRTVLMSSWVESECAVKQANSVYFCCCHLSRSVISSTISSRMINGIWLAGPAMPEMTHHMDFRFTALIPTQHTICLCMNWDAKAIVGIVKCFSDVHLVFF